jgi:hypothetical protein
MRWIMEPPGLDLSCVVLPGTIRLQWIKHTLYHGASTSRHALGLLPGLNLSPQFGCSKCPHPHHYIPVIILRYITIQIQQNHTHTSTSHTPALYVLFMLLITFNHKNNF